MNKAVQRRQTKTALVADSIAKRIFSGRFTDGDRLPSEEKLADSFCVSLGTVQKALGKLAHQGLIVREHGRGTFVAQSQSAPAELRYLRFRDRSGEDLALYVHSHKTKTTHQQGPWSAFLGNAEQFVHIQRIISVSGKFDVLSEFVLRKDEFRRSDALKIKNIERLSLRDILRQQFSLPTIRVERRIAFERLPDRVCKLLGMRAGTTGPVMELLGFTTNDRPFCYQRISSDLFDAVLIVSR